MAYSNNPNLPNARAIALKLVLIEGVSVGVAARKCGIHRSTLWRWKQRWLQLNSNVQLENTNRPNRAVSLKNKMVYCRWKINNLPSIPHNHPATLPDELVWYVLHLREVLQRCAEVIWHHLQFVDGIRVSLSSVRRILRRHHCFAGARKKRVRPDNPRRPRPTKPGEFIQADTVHHVDPFTGQRLYYYTVVDCYTRQAYVYPATRILPGLAAKAVLAAQKYFKTSFQLVQTDNGPEFGRYFEQVLKQNQIQIRHTRLGRPNDNAHIERFNRTVQEECIGSYWRRSVPLHRLQKGIDEYLDYYNNDRVHLGIQLRTPAEMLQRY